MHVAIYARVSTEDKGQDPENQLRDLRAWCTHAGHELVGEYVDRVSGRKGTGERKQFAALFDDASRRKFDCVLFRALGRFSREGMVPTIHHLPTAPPFTATLSRTSVPITRWYGASCWRCSPPWPSRRPKRLSERVLDAAA